MGSGRGTAPPTMGMAGAVPLPRIFFKILVLEIAYYGTFWRHVANISTLQTTYTIYSQWIWMTHTCASHPYRACKLTLCHAKMASWSQTCWNTTMNTCLIFLPKTARDPHQREMVAIFWTTPTVWFQDRSAPNSEDSPCPSVTSYCCCVEGFYLTVFEHQWKTTVKALNIEPQFSQQFFMGTQRSRWRPWFKFNGNFLQFGFWEKWFQNLDLPPSLSASTLIMEPTAHGLHDIESLVTFLQNFSAVATS